LSRVALPLCPAPCEASHPCSAARSTWR
jgi:hypothetical protein